MTAPQSRWHARLAGVLLLLLSGCAGTPPLSPEAARALPASAHVGGVPFHGQRDYQCGPASLAMVLNASGVPVGVDELIPQLFLPGRQGSVQPEMLATVRRHGRIGYPLPDGFDGLLGELAAGHPVVVLQNLSLPAWPLWHYAVVTGYDRERQLLIHHSGEQARQPIAMGRFDATWARSGRWAMVALPPGTLPATLGPAQAAESIAAFEPVAGPEAALPAWQALTARWPGYAPGWFAQGNAQHGGGNNDAAIAAFRQATRQDPQLAAAWLNLGLLQAALGRPRDAAEALARAAALDGPFQARARQALAALPPE
ncbi:PA2778 family cysteine peptidase [Zobellella iuensis]|uniref:PA2778 family cysteine peptidase n=1 Tax=Zobellella iuensis TaxID=2803811 RepID=A0ABS1QQ47_9GAMM|nr:PA2778 family cysteine peptidase [Zobellella iuensis]MBL1376702.1 PA2778 family cysteine peptidase [Zobellella iuensis]